PQLSYFSVELVTGFALQREKIGEQNTQNIIIKEQVVMEFEATTGDLIATYGNIYDALDDCQDDSLLLINTSKLLLTNKLDIDKNITITAKKDCEISRAEGFTGVMVSIDRKATVVIGRTTAETGTNFISKVYPVYGTGVLTFKGNENSTQKVIDNSGKLTLSTEVKITGESSSANLIYSKGDMLTLDGVEIFENTVTGNHLIYCQKEVKFVSGSIYDNESSMSIFLINGKATFEGGVIGYAEAAALASTTEYSNKAQYIILSIGSEDVVIAGTQILYNYTIGDGTSNAVVKFNSTALNKIQGTTIISYNNSGATVYSEREVTIAGGEFAINSGYGFHIKENSLALSGGNIYGNMEGQILLDKANLSYTSGIIGNDDDYQSAFAIKLINESTAEISNTASIFGNTYTVAVIDIELGSSVEMTGATITENTAPTIIKNNGLFTMNSNSAEITNNSVVESVISTNGNSETTIVCGLIAENINADGDNAYSVKIYSTSATFTIGNGVGNNSLLSGLRIQNPVYLITNTIININGNYNSECSIIEVIPENDEDETIIATYVTGATPSEALFSGELCDLTYTLDGQNVIIGQRNIFNATTGKWYTDFAKALAKMDLTKTDNNLQIGVKEFLIAETVKIGTYTTKIKISNLMNHEELGTVPEVTLYRLKGFAGAMFEISGSTVVFGDGVNSFTISGKQGEITGGTSKDPVITTSALSNASSVLFDIKGGTVSFDAKTNIKDVTASVSGAGIKATGSSTTVNLSGITIQSNTTSSNGIVYIDGATVKVKASSVIGAASKANKSKNGGAIYVKSGSLTVEAATFTANESTENGGAIYAKGGTVTINSSNAKFVSNKATGNGGGVYIDGATVELKSGSIETNTAVDGAGVYVNAGTFTMSGGTIKSNTASGNGGGVYTKATFNFNVGTIGGTADSYNTSASVAKTNGGNSASYGGGVYVADGTFTNTTKGTVSIKGNFTSNNGAGLYFAKAWSSETNENAKIVNALRYNYANGKGGAIASAGALTLHSGSIENNQGKTGGGAVFCTNTVTLKGATIKSNSTVDNDTCGGDIYTSVLSMSSGTVESNTAKYGGGIYISSESTTSSVTGGTITKNTASTHYGGGIYSKAPFTLDGGTISDNKAENSTNGWGGGLYLNNTATIKSGTVSGNKAKYGAGVCIIKNTTITGGVIKSNTAASDGGGIYVWTGTLTLNGGQIGTNGSTRYTSTSAAITGGGNAANNGGGIFVGTSGGLAKSNTTAAYIRGNYASTYGGGIYSSAAITTTSSTNAGLLTNMKYNYSTRDGGGIFINGAAFTFSDGEISQNHSGEDGGGIAVHGSSFKMAGGKVFSNKCTAAGGGLYVTGTSTTFAISGGSIYSNEAGSFGGGIYTSAGGSSSITGGSIYSNKAVKGGGYGQNGGTVSFGAACIGKSDASSTASSSSYSNYASQYGGGVYVMHGTFKLNSTSGKIYYNYAGNDGGGICLRKDDNNTSGSPKLENSGGNIRYNRAGGNGGGIALLYGTFSDSSTSLNVNNNIAGSYGGGIYTVINTSIKFNIYSNSASKGGGVWANAGTVTADTGTKVYSNAATAGNAGGIYIHNTASMSFKGGSVYSNTASGEVAGGIMHNSSGTTTISGGSIYSNSSKYGGGVAVYSGTVKMTSGTIGRTSETTAGGSDYSNYAGSNGGGVYIYGSGTFDMDGGVVGGNLSWDGGGIYLSAGTLKLGGSGTPNVRRNRANGSGGGLCLVGGSFSNDGASSVRNNSAASHGGGVYTSINYTAREVKGNAAGGSGGGIIQTAGTVTINSNSSIDGNSATNNGGGIYVKVALSMSGGIIKGNSATKGGGVYLDAGTITMTDGRIGSSDSSTATNSAYSNRSSTAGGGIYMNTGTLNIGGGSVTYNSTGGNKNDSGTGGGGIYMANNGAVMRIKANCYVDYNYSAGNGSGIYVNSYKNRTMRIYKDSGVCYLRYNTTAWRGAFFLYYKGSNYGFSAFCSGGFGTFSVAGNNSVGCAGSDPYQADY
ncbi:MAG: hypothetical protein IKA31_02655, partial [Clostridia bacterium]|nr:hypothetical protein [Clostridia bacterium]